MAILINENTRGRHPGHHRLGRLFHAKQCIAYGTQVVAGCTPNRGGETFSADGPDGKSVGVPVFDTVAEAVKETKADTSLHLRAGRSARPTRSSKPWTRAARS